MNIFFDLDGTLTDAAPGITRCLEHALRRLGRESPPLAALRRFVGPPLHDTFAELLGSRDTGAVEGAIRLYRERFVEVGMFENELYPGVPEGLASLGRAGHRMWVVTSKPTVYADRIVRHFELTAWLQGVYGSEMSGANADKRQLLREVLQRERLAAPDCWMVGDRMHDIRAARENGISCVGVSWGYGTAEELGDAGPDHIVGSMAELCELLAPVSRKLPG